MTLKKRLAFLCWNCGKEFTLSRDWEGDTKPKFTFSCYSCGAECIADLDPYRDDTVEVLRSGETQTTGTHWNFPAVIPTTAPENTD